MFDDKTMEFLKLKFFTMSKNDSLQWENISNDMITFVNYYQWYSNLALRTFKWRFQADFSLLDSSFIEKMLFFRGACAIVNDKSKGLMLCAFTNISTKYNYFGYPTRIQAYDIFNNGKVIGDYDEEDFVIIPNNILWYPTNLIIIDKANKISNLSEAIDINTDGQKIPVVFQGTPEQKETMKQLGAKYVKGERPLFIPKELNVNDITALNPDVPMKALELIKTRDCEQAELLTMIGINNINISKESGVTDEEVRSNNQLVTITFDSFKDAREEAIKEIKEKFNLDITLEYDKNVKTDEIFTETVEESEVL